MKNWNKYSGDYLKKFCDIKTFDGREFKQCWPNAQIFHARTGESIPEKDVEFIKYVPIDWN